MSVSLLRQSTAALMFVLSSPWAEAAEAASAPRLMTPQELQSLVAQPADVRSSYGADADQFGELRVPAGDGPFPVVVLIHGGCFVSEYATLSDLAPMGDALKARGIASWNVEYRRLHQPGSGWPGTYRDVGAALDHLRTLTDEHRLDLDRVVVVGHSAGGHLALWAAARHRLGPRSDLYVRDPLRVRGVVDLAGLTDLEEDLAGYERVCRAPVLTALLGGSPKSVPQRYRDASPRRLLPLGVPQVIMAGEYEDQVPIPGLREHVERARRLGDDARLDLLPAAGHFEIASPQASTWPRVEAAILELLNEK